MADLKETQASLIGLQQTLEDELGKVADSTSDLLPAIEAEEEKAKSQDGDASVPAAQKQAKASIERFQKLCRDAKRRAIGS